MLYSLYSLQQLCQVVSFYLVSIIVCGNLIDEQAVDFVDSCVFMSFFIVANQLNLPEEVRTLNQFHFYKALLLTIIMIE